jgi:hypothetical protein
MDFDLDSLGYAPAAAEIVGGIIGTLPFIAMTYIIRCYAVLSYRLTLTGKHTLA